MDARGGDGPARAQGAAILFLLAAIAGSASAQPQRKGCDRTRCAEFAHAYDFSRHGAAPDEFHRGERSGAAIAVGIGAQYAGLGAHLAWYFVPAERAFAFVPYVGAGVAYIGSADDVAGPVAGAMAMVGEIDRWILDASFGVLDARQLSLHGVSVATRAVYALTPSIGYEWMSSSGIFSRLLVGVPLFVDAKVDVFDTFPVVTYGLGYKAW